MLNIKLPFILIIIKLNKMALSIKIKPLILIGSQGSGRSALSFNLIRKFPNKFQRVISHTTRKPRPSQKQKQHYYFVDQNFITDNMQKFVTLTKSTHNHFYGLLGSEIVRVIQNNKIPIFKMTLEAYKTNISRDGSLQITQNPTAVEKVASSLFKGSKSRFLTRNKLIQCNSLYVTVSNIKQLERRLVCSPVSQKQRLQRIEKAEKEQKEFNKYFEEEDIIRSQQDMDKTIQQLQSRLFELY